MSVLIKGVTMPKNGESVTIILQNGYAFEPADGGYIDHKVIEVPKHGDLVDRHVMIGKIEELRSITACFGDDYSRGKTMAYSCAEVEVANAPTVIEAEE